MITYIFMAICIAVFVYINYFSKSIVLTSQNCTHFDFLHFIDITAFLLSPN